VTVERPLNCDEITSMKGSIDDYCLAALDAQEGSNPKLTSAQDTGRVVDTCAGIAGVISIANGGKAGEAKTPASK
jgi:hypothetical protein